MEFLAVCYKTKENKEEEVIKTKPISTDEVLSIEELFEYFLNVSEELRKSLPEELSKGKYNCYFQMTYYEEYLLYKYKSNEERLNQFSYYKGYSIPIENTAKFKFIINNGEVNTERSFNIDDFYEDEFDNYHIGNRTSENIIKAMKEDFVEWLFTDKELVAYLNTTFNFVKGEPGKLFLHELLEKLKGTEFYNVSNDMQYRVIKRMTKGKTLNDLEKTYDAGLELREKFETKLTSFPIWCKETNLSTLYSTLDSNCKMLQPVLDHLNKLIVELKYK